MCIVSFNLSNAQFNKDAFRTEICQCLEQEKLRLRLNENTYNKCFQEILPNYATQIDAEIEEADANKRYSLGQMARRDLMLAFKYELIYTCEIYYEFVESLRVAKKLLAQENTKESDLEQQNKEVAMRPNAMSYLRRAQLHFRLNNLKAAEADVKKSLEVNPYSDNVKSTRKESMLLAWVYEEQGHYAKAIELYDSINLGVYDTDVAILRAIVDKKSGGTMANIPAVSKESKSDTSKNSKTRDRSSTRQIKDKTKNKEVKAKKKKKDTSSLRKLLKIGN